MEFATLAQTIVNILMLSSMYVMAALGFALILNVLGVLNFAHAAIYTVGGYLCYIFAVNVGLPVWVAMFMSALSMGLVGLVLERLFFRPLRGDMNRIVVVTLALIVILTAGINVTIGAYKRSIPAFMDGIIRIGPASISTQRVATFALGFFLLGAFWLFLKKTRVGLQMLAIAQDAEGAALQGINVNRISAVTTALGCALAAVAGSLMGAILALSPFMGDQMLVKAIEIVILAGIGSFGGVLLAGLLLAGVDATLPLFFSGYVTELTGLAIIIVILIFRPRGLFGREM
jgi:branched-chain amino acid transport system permease protein